MKRKHTFFALATALFLLLTTHAQGTMISPLPGTSINSTSVTFEWEAVPGASQYYLFVGSEPFNSDIYMAPLGLNTSAIVALPSKPMYYVTVIHNVNGSWIYTHFIYSGATGVTPSCEYTGPTPDTILSNPTTFTWKQLDPDVRYQYVQITMNENFDWVTNKYVRPSYREATINLPEDGGALFVKVKCYSSSKGWTVTPTYLYTAPY